jgi:hypothetical protein
MLPLTCAHSQTATQTATQIATQSISYAHMQALTNHASVDAAAERTLAGQR